MCEFVVSVLLLTRGAIERYQAGWRDEMVEEVEDGRLCSPACGRVWPARVVSRIRKHIHMQREVCVFTVAWCVLKIIFMRRAFRCDCTNAVVGVRTQSKCQHGTGDGDRCFLPHDSSNDDTL